MANLQHLKASRTKVLKTFPVNNFGKEGDIVVSMISGKGTYLCIKAGGEWHTATKMKSLSRLGKTGSDSFIAKDIQVKSMKNATSDTDKFVVLENNNLKYRNSEELLSDLDSDALSINYKTAYCSLGQYNNKKECESGGGTWYYSENDSHDSISSVAENELLTVGSSIGKVDAESTLTYDGSTLEIKYNSEFDDNWQTSAQTNLLKLSYDSSNYSTFDVGSGGNLTLDTNGDIALSADGGNVTMDDGTTTIFDFDVDGVNLKIMDDANTNDYFNISVGAEGATTLSTVDADTAVGHLTLQPDGDLVLDPVSQKIIINAQDDLYFDGGTHTYITESADDVLRIVVGNEIMLQLDEGNDLSTNLHSVKVGKSLFLEEQADALADVAGDGQLWVHDDAPNNLYFTDDAGNDINISRPTQTAVWGGNLARVTGSGTHFAIPTGYLMSNIGLGTGSDPDTSLTCGTNADDITTCVWFSLNAIKVLSCTIMIGQGGATNTGHTCTLMRYDIDADGDWSNGIVVGQTTAMNSDDYSQARRNTLTMSTTESELQVSTSQILVGCVEPLLGYNTAMSAKVCLKYQEVQ